MAIFQFFLPNEKLIEVNFFLVPTRKILMMCDQNLQKFHKNQ